MEEGWGVVEGVFEGAVEEYEEYGIYICIYAQLLGK